MPTKHNDARRHHIPKMRFKVTNWAAHKAGLRRRGSLTLWVSDEAITAWRAVPRTTPGGQAHCSHPAIATALMVRLVFLQPLRQTEDCSARCWTCWAWTCRFPTTPSRRASHLAPVLATALPDVPVT